MTPRLANLIGHIKIWEGSKRVSGEIFASGLAILQQPCILQVLLWGACPLYPEPESPERMSKARLATRSSLDR